MKIRIMNQEHKLNIIIPTSLLTGLHVRKLILPIIYKHAGDTMPFPEEQMAALLREFKKAAKRHKGLRLVEVHSANGDQVLVQL